MITLGFCIIASVIFLCVTAVWLGRRHRHKWKVVSAWKHPGYAVTYIALRCACGELKNQSIDGHHSLESLQGEPDEIAQVLSKLERSSR